MTQQRSPVSERSSCLENRRKKQSKAQSLDMQQCLCAGSHQLPCGLRSQLHQQADDESVDCARRS